MILYIVKGRVLPIRAALTFGPIRIQLSDEKSMSPSTNLELTIYANEVTIYYEAEYPRDIYDIKNECLYYCNAMVAQIGFLVGFGYSIEVNQILCRELDINIVYGIDIPCLSERNKGLDLNLLIQKIFSIKGPEVRYLHRCFVDLQLAITHPIDTPFYCYRAIESLRHFCRIRYNLAKEQQQWQKLSELTKKGWDDTKSVKIFANDARHGDHKGFSSEQRAEFFITTWELVDGFIDSVGESSKVDTPEPLTQPSNL